MARLRRQPRSPDADRRVARRERDQRAADRHEPDRKRHRRLPAGAIAIGPDQRAAERPGDEPDAERGGGSQIADERVVRRKERLADHPQEGGVDREVEELETIAEDRREDAFRPERRPRGARRCFRIGGQASLPMSRRGAASQGDAAVVNGT
jgi:hypothetical protein